MAGLAILVIGGVLIGWAFSLGRAAGALSRGPALPDDLARSLRGMALNLREPLINALLIGGLAVILRVGSPPTLDGRLFSRWGEPGLFGEVAAVAWPLLALALPLGGVWTKNRLARRIALETSALGLLRAAVTIWTLLDPMLLPAGAAVLLGCCLWAEQRLAALRQSLAAQADGGGRGNSGGAALLPPPAGDDRSGDEAPLVTDAPGAASLLNRR